MMPPRSLALSIGGAVVALLAFLAIPSRPELAPAFSHASVKPGPAHSPDVADAHGDGARRDEQLARAEFLAWGRNPFFSIVLPPETEPTIEPVDAPIVEAPPAAPIFRLTGISVRDGVHLAIIDHKIVREGYELPSGFVVIKIDRSTVTLSRGDHELLLALGDE